jgi:hypothetical protein
MLVLYRLMLRLYPPAHRAKFGEEMMAVLQQGSTDSSHQPLAARFWFAIRETTGLLRGALQERAQSILETHAWDSFPNRRFTMHSSFRFPRATPWLMAVILVAVVLAIEKATAIRASVPDVNPPVGPIRPEHFTFLPAMLLIFAAAYAIGVVGWIILFVLHRSGTHRLDAMQDSSR